MIPSVNDLHYFMEVAHCANISRAAENLGISQPSLTLAMRRIEEALGESVFIRHKRGVTLTHAGKLLLANARQLIQQWEAIKTGTLATANEAHGTFTIGCHASVARYALPKFLPKLLQQNPKLEIRLQHNLSRKIVEQVVDLSIDIGIVINPVKHPDLIMKKLYDDEITLWQAEKPSKMQDLKSGNAVLLCDSELVQTQFILKALKKKGLQFAQVIHSHNLEVLADLTANGCGIGILPGGVASLCKLKPIDKAPSYHDEAYLIYRGENRHVKAIQVISTAIKTAFEKKL